MGDLAQAIDDDKVSAKQDPKARRIILRDEFEWDPNDALKIWCFGPETTGPNMVVDVTKAVQYLNEIQCPNDTVGGIYNCLATRRGIVIGEEPISGTPLVNMKAYLPVAESFGFTQALRAATSGRAFPQCV